MAFRAFKDYILSELLHSAERATKRSDGCEPSLVIPELLTEHLAEKAFQSHRYNHSVSFLKGYVHVIFTVIKGRQEDSFLHRFKEIEKVKTMLNFPKGSVNTSQRDYWTND
ncbi:hypothetical protein M514_03097 [Trichuris suis]|uniref:Uncharacterized protein n=1 Tax=Trichuris suis TaxID=68888 RepID=A0A085MFH7_9BILA|nr:hypothetical protein M513_03097 [Trichuris suis]KFD68269.1 hypothetical protein M514_03097 [Trichuris suis]